MVGRVGCGKSTLLQTVMNETVLLKGSLDVKGSIAYVEQEPFIISGTVKENICFGNEYDKANMDRAIRLASMTTDIEKFGKGIDEMIGERGINMSGGQKARLSLARAIYSDADIMLFDDPLSAVDTKISKAIFMDCIKEGCKDKLVILVTHQIQFLEHCPKIMLVKEDQSVVVGDN